MYDAAHAKRRLDRLFMAHAALSAIIGVVCFLLPHGVAFSLLSSGHWAHELIRLYGAVSLALAYIVYRTLLIADLLLRKTLAEAFCVCFSLQVIVMLRAQVSSPDDHSILGWITILAFSALAGAYGYIRFATNLKTFSSFESLDKSVN